jgi:homogentisate 1,2-dioxygenase
LTPIQVQALAGALPIAQNTPQKPPYGLYTEKISGTSFTSDRGENQQTWLYRIIPAAAHSPFELEGSEGERSAAVENPKLQFTPTQLRWDPFDLDETSDWPHSMHLLAGAGDASTRTGLGFLIFTAGSSMDAKSAFYSADGDLLIILQQGVLDIRTELGHLLVRPNEICVIPRGIRYNVSLPEGPVRGYALELYQGRYTLPNLGPLGSFGLANARDFQVPVASFDEDTENTYRIIAKFNNNLFVATQDHTPFDIVSWHGLYYPYKYDLGRFLAVGSISYDHPDPSIFTLLSTSEGIAEMAIFPPRWLVMEDTFRPPWYHRNTMAEFMGLIQGEYDARVDGGFRPGGASLHNVMAGHGPDSSTHERAMHEELVPKKVGEGSMAFVLENSMLLGVSEWGLKKCNKLQHNYNTRTWLPLKSKFRRPARFEALKKPVTLQNGTHGIMEPNHSRM